MTDETETPFDAMTPEADSEASVPASDNPNFGPEEVAYSDIADDLAGVLEGLPDAHGGPTLADVANARQTTLDPRYPDFDIEDLTPNGLPDELLAPPGTPGGAGGTGPTEWITTWLCDFPFKFTMTAADGGTISEGFCFYAGESIAISSITFPQAITISGTGTTYYWVDIDLANSTASWNSAASWPAGWGDDDSEIWPILQIAHTSSVITSWKQHEWSNIHITRSA